ncbi:MAG: hypothetical protein K0R21_918 [Anaerocolumna sp.]|jgi:hypothetical protein|nr:hypothetical protein [Anaerocolumna sp.]
MLSNNVSVSNANIHQSSSTNGASTAPANSLISENLAAGLEKGQIIRGEIVDVTYKEIGVKLEDGRVLTGRLEDATNLSIGDKVAFRVEDISFKNLVLKIISDLPSTLIQNTIDKALEAAGLNKTNLNQNIVNELLKQQMPVDKKTISFIIQQSLANKNTPVSTLILMHRFHIPVTSDNVKLFDTFINKNMNLLGDMEQLANTISEMEGIDNPMALEEKIVYGKEILQMILKEGIETNSTKNPLSSIIDTTANKGSFVLTSTESNVSSISNTGEYQNDQMEQIQNKQSLLSQSANTLLSNLLTGEELTSFVSFLKANPGLQSFFPETVMKQLGDGTAKVNDVTSLLKQVSQSVDNASVIQLLKQAPQIDTIMSASTLLPDQTSAISSFLSRAERSNLSELLNSFSLPADLKIRIQTGTVSANEVLQWVKNKLSTQSEDTLRNLFHSKEFKSLVKDSLMDRWTITPQELKSGELEKHLDSLGKHINELKEYAEQTAKQPGETILNQTKNIQNNISLTHTLNELFTYVPLPLKLKNQNAHGELYVYTNKKSTAHSKDGIRILLHLDMDNLGPVDIHINLAGNTISNKFYLEDEDTVNLLHSNINRLEQNLESKGYFVNTEILTREKEINPMDELINQNPQVSLVTRYNFDVRA